MWQENKSANPLPWGCAKIEQRNIFEIFSPNGVDDKKRVVAEAYSSGNSALIIRAVNNHDKLIERLRAALDILEGYADVSSAACVERDNIIGLLRELDSTP